MLSLKKKNPNDISNIIGTDTMRKKMGEVLDCVYFRGDEFVIERKHKPIAMLVPIGKYDALNKLAREIIVATLSKQTNHTISEEESYEIANEVKHLVRQSK